MNRRSLLVGAPFFVSGLGAATFSRASVVDEFGELKRPMDTMNRAEGWYPGVVKPLEIKGRRIGEGRPKMIAPTTGKTPEALLADVSRFAGMSELDMVEVRIDYLGRKTPEEFAAVTRRAYEAAGDKIVLVTLRNGTDGGPFAAEDKYYGSVYREIIKSGRADIIDLELFRGVDMIRELTAAAHEKGIKVIISDHEFKFMPDEAELIRRLLLEDQMGADILKLAVMAFAPEDALAVMSATAKVRHYYSNKPMLTMAMGKWGVLTRITGEGFGSDLTFVSVGGKASAPGQIPAQDCRAVLETLHKAMNP